MGPQNLNVEIAVRQQNLTLPSLYNWQRRPRLPPYPLPSTQAAGAHTAANITAHPTCPYRLECGRGRGRGLCCPKSTHSEYLSGHSRGGIACAYLVVIEY
jgi:hypothetical protein